MEMTNKDKKEAAARIVGQYVDKVSGRIDRDVFVGYDPNAVQFFWTAYKRSWDFSSGPEDERDGICTVPLQGNPRDGYEIVLRRVAEVDKVRMRIENRLRKGDEKEILRVAVTLGIDIEA